MTAILGGGISGLSAAYYLLKTSPQKLTILESSSILGGWIKTIDYKEKEFVFEKGPRTIRPGGLQGLNTLKLIEELDLADKLFYIPKTHPSARNRLIFSNKKLYSLPSSFSALFKTNPPFSKPLFFSAFTDLTAHKTNKDDESIYSFVERRLGKELADYLISPMICGICAGDAKEISVKFLMANLFEWEKKYGSILKGFIKNALLHKPDLKQFENSLLAKRSLNEKWSVWTLEGGLKQLPEALGKIAVEKGAKIKLNSKCTKLEFEKNNQVKCSIVEGNDSKMTGIFDHIICSLPATKLAQLVGDQHPILKKELLEIKSVTVAVVNIAYKGNHLKHNAFGFLAPPREKIPILGVIFDSCNFDYKDWTVLTVMMGGRWYEEYFGSSATEEELLETALTQVSSILDIREQPEATHVSILKDCIPQYTVGHSQRVENIMTYIKEHKLPLTLIGSSYYGVGINDVIYTARNAVSKLNDS